ncbi:MAG: hypothetical protein R3B54_18215 [Bdellovibrionota bacterium]
MKYLVWTLLTVFLVSCASTPKSGDKAEAGTTSEKEKTTQASGSESSAKSGDSRFWRAVQVENGDSQD